MKRTNTFVIALLIIAASLMFFPSTHRASAALQCNLSGSVSGNTISADASASNDDPQGKQVSIDLYNGSQSPNPKQCSGWINTSCSKSAAFTPPHTETVEADCYDGDGGFESKTETFVIFGGEPPTHFTCVDNACHAVDGYGANEGGCSGASHEGDQCGGTPPTTHNECINDMCTKITGAGTDDCANPNSTCSDSGSGGGTNPHHYECQNNSCVQVSGNGNNSCTNPGGSCDDGGTTGSNPTYVDITVNSNVIATWHIYCVANSANAAAGCPSNTSGTGLVASGTTAFYAGLMGTGTYMIKFDPIAGYNSQHLNGASSLYAAFTVPSAPNQTVHIVWNMVYDNEACGAQGFTLIPSATETTVGATITISWNNIDCEQTYYDWIGLVPAGSNWTAGDPWKWWDDTTSQHGPTPITPRQGSVSLVVPPGHSQLEAVYYRSGGFGERVRTVPIHVNGVTENQVTFGCKVPAYGGVWSHTCTVTPTDQVILQWDAPGAAQCTTNGWGSLLAILGQLPINVGSLIPANLLHLTATCVWHTTALNAPKSLAQTILRIFSAHADTSSSDSVTLNVAKMDLKCAGSNTVPNDGPCIIPSGQNVSLSWTSSFLDTCTASGGWSGLKPANGSMDVGPITQSQPFILTCSTPNGPTLTDTVNVTVAGTPQNHTVCVRHACTLAVCAAGSDCTNQCATDTDCGGEVTPGTCAMTATPDRLVIPPPASSTLAWQCNDVVNCHIDQGIGAVNPEGSTPIAPPQTTQYTITCDGAGGGTSASATAVTEVKVRVFHFDGGGLKEILPR